MITGLYVSTIFKGLKGKVERLIVTGSQLCIRGKKSLSKANSSNGRDSIGRRLGIKMGEGSLVGINEIVIRQRGYKWRPGRNVSENGI